MQIIFDGEEAFQNTKEMLKSAKKKIWICMYMIRFDSRIKELWRIIDQKHEEGLDVRVWYDGFGSARSVLRLSECPFAKMYVPKWWRLGTRNHAKVIIIDDKEVSISGRNWTKRYFEEWVDTSIVLEKQSNVKQVLEFAKRIEQKSAKNFPKDTIFRYTDPLRREKTVYHFVLEHIVQAKKEIQIASPYFVIDDAIEALMLAAMDRGVKITIIVPNKPEHKMAKTFNRINFQRIYHENLNVKRSEGMFHSKVMLFDETAMVGSANFDNRSFKLNTELSVVMEKKHIAAIRKHLEEVADHSVTYNWIQRQYDYLLYHFTRHLMELL